MKICFLTTSYPLHPAHFAGNFIRNSALTLTRAGHSVTVIAPDDFSALPIEDDNGVQVHRFQYLPSRKMQSLAYGHGILPNLKARPLTFLQLIPFILAFRKAALRYCNNADIIHAHWSISGIAAIACTKKYKIPVILGLRGSDFSGPANSLSSRITKHLFRKVRGVTTVNEALRQKAVASGAAPNTCRVIRNGVDIDTFTPTKSKSSFKNTPAASADLAILFAGRLTKVKGPDIALRAFETLCDKTDINIHLVYAGDGDMRASLQKQTAESETLNKRVSFLGEIQSSQMAKYYQSADLLLISSRSEGLPNALLEGMSCGLPVVSTPVGGVPEVIKDNCNGYLAKDFTPDAIAAKLLSAVNDTAHLKQVGINARNCIMREMSWDIHSANLLSFYKMIMGEREE